MGDTVLAAVNASPACSPVLGFAKLFASTLRSRVRAVHVLEGQQSEAVGDLAFREGVDLQVVDGDPMREIVLAGHDPDVGLVVAGAHDLPDSAGPGHVARGIAMRLRGPLLVVPAKAVVPARLERLLIPLEGTEATTAPIRGLLEYFAFRPETELVTLHVFTLDDIPPFENHAPHEADAWVHEFRDRYVPAGTPQATIERRFGRVEQVVPEVADTINATLTVVSWSQDLAPNHARLVNALLKHPSRPTLLVPSNYQRRDGDDRLPAAGFREPGPGRGQRATLSFGDLRS